MCSILGLEQDFPHGSQTLTNICESVLAKAVAVRQRIESHVKIVVAEDKSIAKSRIQYGEGNELP